MQKALRYFLLLIGSFLFGIACSKKTEQANLNLSSSAEHFLAVGGNRDIIVNASTSWSVSDTSWWCSTNISNDKLTIIVQPNVTIATRSSTLFVKAGGITKELVVTQDGAIPIDPNAGVLPDSIAPDQADMRNMSSIDLAKEMKLGWNLGNSLEAIGGETAWGNPMVNQRLIDSVRKAGFNAVRIPVAWSRFTDAATFKIDTAWMSRVEQVVNYVLKNDMYAIMNIHWDGGWMQPTNAKKDYVNNRLAIMWKQIAKRFRHFNDHLLFAGTNEVMVDGDYGTPTPEYYNAQNSFNQTFVTTVRATGGRNAYRHLVVQGFNTNIDYTINFFQTPVDKIDHRLMIEVHYYDPYNFTINENSSITQWGMNATDPAKTETWANEAYADAQFQKMKTKFIDNGFAVILGEYAAMARLNLGSPALNAEHAAFREYYLKYVTKSIIDHGLIPFYWDSGFTGNFGSGLFDRTTGGRAYPSMIDALTKP